VVLHLQLVEVQNFIIIFHHNMLNNDQNIRSAGWFHNIESTYYDAWYIGGILTQPYGGGVLGSNSPSPNILYAVPYLTGHGGVVDDIRYEVTATGGVGRCGIYTSTSHYNPYPDQLLLDSGENVHSTTGIKSTTTSTRLPENSLVWFVYLQSLTSNVRAISAGSGWFFLGSDSSMSTSIRGRITISYSYGSLPATFPAGGSTTSTIAPAIGVHYSS
jgi:hypothetical protein